MTERPDAASKPAPTAVRAPSPGEPPLFRWDWRGFAVVAIVAVPAVLVTWLGDAHLGLGMFLGLIPAGFARVPPRRKQRLQVLVLAIVLPLSVLIGTALKEYTDMWIAAVAIGVLGFLAANWLADPHGRPIGIVLAIPAAGIGLSYDDVGVPIGLLAVMLGASLLALGVSMLFPERKGPVPPPPPRPPRVVARKFGVRLGLALTFATLAGWTLDHTGWVVGSTGLVMRPSEQMQEFRSLWRVGAVLVGATGVSLVLLSHPGPGLVGAVSALAMMTLGGLSASRAYFAPALMTVVIFLMIEYPVTSTQSVIGWLGERIAWVCIGVVIAFVFGLFLPWLEGEPLPGAAKRAAAKAAAEREAAKATTTGQAAKAAPQRGTTDGATPDGAT